MVEDHIAGQDGHAGGVEEGVPEEEDDEVDGEEERRDDGEGEFGEAFPAEDEGDGEGEQGGEVEEKGDPCVNPAVEVGEEMPDGFAFRAGGDGATVQGLGEFGAEVAGRLRE